MKDRSSSLFFSALISRRLHLTSPKHQYVISWLLLCCTAFLKGWKQHRGEILGSAWCWTTPHTRCNGTVDKDVIFWAEGEGSVTFPRDSKLLFSHSLCSLPIFNVYYLPLTSFLHHLSFSLSSLCFVPLLPLYIRYLQSVINKFLLLFWSSFCA